MIQIHAAWKPEQDDGSIHRQWASDICRSLDEFALPGGYANILGPEDRERAGHAFGGNADRLKTVKRHYDPEKIFASAISLPE
jgi:hypothetical protein